MPPGEPFYKILVPTVDTTRYAYIFEKSMLVERPVLLTGHSGVGKSVVIADMMTKMCDKGGWSRIDMSFSAQTNARRTQETIESKLDKRKKTLLGPPPGKKLCMFVECAIRTPTRAPLTRWSRAPSPPLRLAAH